MLVFNKQYRIERKRLREIKKKIRNTGNISVDCNGYRETYQLDSCKIQFLNNSYRLTVFDNSGVKVFSACRFLDDSLNLTRRMGDKWCLLYDDVLEKARRCLSRSNHRKKKDEKIANQLKEAIKEKERQLAAWESVMKVKQL